MALIIENLRLLKPRFVLTVSPKLAFACFSVSAKTQDNSPSEIKASALPFDEIPGPKGLPLLGSLFEFIKEGGIQNLHNMSAQRFEKYGPLFKDTILGRTLVHLSKPAEVENLLRADGKYPNRPELIPLAFLRKQQNIHLGISQL